ncbi:transcription termination factor Rho [Haloferula sp.]|uniref:transcription termination factor Rho n=1 Tax=Haloferula sp. TaxID=2497595 RepID=UPI003C7740D6
MSDDTTEEARKSATSKAGDPPVKKKAARKAASKKATKKVAAKKATKKVAKKSAKTVDSAQATLPLDTPAPEREKPEKKEKPSAPVEKSAVGESSGEGAEPVRFGRVPGGGPVQREERQQEDSKPEKRERPSDRDEKKEHGDRQSRSDRGGNDRGGNDRGGNDRNVGGERSERDDGRRRKRRRNRRRGDRSDNNRGDRGDNNRGERGDNNRGDNNRGEGRQGRNRDDNEMRDRPVVLEGPKVEVDGLLEMAPKGFGFLRLASKKFEQAKDDAFVSPDLVRSHGLRVGVWIHGLTQEGPRGPQLVEITSINGMPPEEARKLPAFEELKAINPNKRISLETTQDRYTTRVVDLMSPVGRGQRGLIVSPPRSGKTTLLLHIAEAVNELHDETMHLMVVLVDERPEEVTEFRRCLPEAEIYASSNDDHPRNHTRIAEIAIERAKRLVEGGQHVFLLMDSITRLARAYNGGMRGKGRGIGSGGVMVGALETPRRLFAAARNTREAGSLTILATALIQTNSRADDAIFQEFKGTGNMELVLDRKVAENYIYPAVDIFKSGTRREELLLPEHTLHKIHMIRRGLSGHRPEEAMERLLYFLKKFPNNPQMLLEIKG